MVTSLPVVLEDGWTVRKKLQHYNRALPESTESEIENYKRRYLEKLSLSEYQIKTLEIITKRQNQCEEWYIERKKRLTASLFGKICKLREKTSRVKTVNDILFGTFTGNAATRYGIANEIVAKEQLEAQLKIKILPSGLFVDINLPFLAASPDGIIFDDSLVEIKCPASAKELLPEEAVTIGKIKSCLVNNGQLQLKRSDNYYYQVQGQLHISRRMYCYFCIWTPKGLMYEKIQRDDEFWENNMKVKLELFYLKHLLPSLIKEEILMTN